MGVTGWWRSRGLAARVDLCVRISFYLNLAAAPFLVAGAARADAGGTGVWAAGAFAAVHALVCAFLVRAGLDHYLGRRDRPLGLIAGAGTLTVAGCASALLAWPDAAPGQPSGPSGALPLMLIVAFLTALATAVRPRVTIAAGLLACAGVYALSVAAGDAGPLGAAVGMAMLLLVTGVISRVSAWMLGVLWELDRSRHVQAELAVVEERLRFARDLHDVVGRSLSVVALKAELAAQLSRRGRAEATDEMLEVRRIARESLAELRAVVGGYRAADLDVELSGARALLASAGIACEVVGDGGDLPPDVQGTLGWVVREATTNVLRHSEARSCVITLRRSGAGEVTLTMDNDGVPADARVRFGSGLTGLTERVGGLGGTVTAGRRPPDGFRLAAEVPLTLAVAPGVRP
ncbi:histidine kinase [Longispora sp. NPDC051575]|uniref:sensor histidine kinase n=1 Tax=Longispora sp. NPDC051575 TaxID=3154943 RepID=UPI00343AC328